MIFVILIDIYLVMGILYVTVYVRPLLDRLSRLLKGKLSDKKYLIKCILHTLLFPLYLPSDIRDTKLLDEIGY